MVVSENSEFRGAVTGDKIIDSSDEHRYDATQHFSSDHAKCDGFKVVITFIAEKPGRHAFEYPSQEK